MKFVCYDSFSLLPVSAHLLIRQQSENNLYLSELWFSTMLSAGLEANANVVICTVENEEECLALVFLRSPAGQNGSKFSHWIQSKHSLAGLTNFQSSFFSVLINDQHQQQAKIIDTLVSGLAYQRPALHLIDVNLMSPKSNTYHQLELGFRGHNFSCHPYLYKGNWYEEFQFTNFSEYISSRDKSNRKSIKNYQRKLRKLEREGHFAIRLLTNESELCDALDVYQTIYQASWKEPDLFSNFYPQLIQATAKQGSLRFLCIYLDGKPVAFEFAIVTGKQCVMMRTAYIREYQHESVGSLAILLMMQHVIEQDKVTEIDFGTDDDRYKSTWVKERRERWGLANFNRYTPLGRFYWSVYVINAFKNNAKTKMKHLINKTVNA